MRTRRLAALLPLAALVVGACSSAGTPTPAGSTPPAATESAAASPSGGTAAYTVNAGNNAAVGGFLTGEDGMTLYVKQGDTTAASNCTGQCLTAWPPFTLDSGETVAAGTGVSGTLATFQRPEGQTQVTYNGMPLYYYSKDTKAGDTNGQGVAGVWSVAAP